MPRWNERVAEEMLNVWLSNPEMTAKEMAKKFGVNLPTIYQMRSDLGIASKKTERKWKWTNRVSKWPKPYRYYKEFVFERDGNKCVYCGDEAVQLDHKIPQIRGGSHAPSNLVATCARCNNLKGTSCFNCPEFRKQVANV